MPTYAQLAADLLKDAATFYKTLGSQNPQMAKDMHENAIIYERMAGIVLQSPTGQSPTGHSYAELTAKLLTDTAIFFRKIANKNEPIRDHLEHTANIYDDVAKALRINPLGVID